MSSSDWGARFEDLVMGRRRPTVSLGGPLDVPPVFDIRESEADSLTVRGAGRVRIVVTGGRRDTEVR